MSDEVEPDADKMPADEQLEEPSTEKDPGEEPKDAEPEPEEVDHEAVGIGVVDTPEPGEELPAGNESSPETDAGGGAQADAAPPTDAVTDEVRSAAVDAERPEESSR